MGHREEHSLEHLAHELKRLTAMVEGGNERSARDAQALLHGNGETRRELHEVMAELHVIARALRELVTLLTPKQTFPNPTGIAVTVA